MNSSLLRLFGVILTTCTVTYMAENHEEPMFVTISHFRSLRLEELYMKIKKSNSKTLFTSAETMAKICRDVTTSEFFRMIKRGPVDIYDIYLESNVKYENLTLYHFNHPAKLISVALTTGVIQETAFICPARNHLTNEIEEYYISQPYNVNAASKWTNKYIFGHFIFRYTEPTKANIHSFVEESAKAQFSPQYNVEELYLQARENRTIAELRYERDDPLCTLNKFEKMRICASVLGSSRFKGKITFTPKTMYVSSRCEKKRVFFSSYTLDLIKEDYLVDQKYEEWMIVCTVNDISSWFSAIYISRGYHPNNVFVFVEDDTDNERGLYLDNLSTNISLFVDKMPIIG